MLRIKNDVLLTWQWEKEFNFLEEKKILSGTLNLWKMFYLCDFFIYKEDHGHGYNSWGLGEIFLNLDS